MNLKNDDRFCKDRLARVLRRASHAQLTWLQIALGLEQQRRADAARTAEHVVPPAFPFRAPQRSAA